MTSIAGGRAVIAGGRTWDGKAIGKVLLFNPEADRPLSAIGDLAEPRYLHTAALMAGEDGITGTLDDFILIAGGTNGSHSLSSLAAVRLDPLSPDRLSVEPLEAKLQRPRMYHTAVFIPPAFLLIDGGRSAAPSGGGGILPVAELLELDSRGERISVGRRWEFRTLARMRHSTTFLGTGPDGAAWVLGYGGFGTWPEGQILRDRQAQADPRRGLEDRFNPDEGVVLAAPELLRIEAGPGSTAEAKLDVMPLDFEFRHEMLRYDHRAAPVLFDALTARGGEARQVLIAGGSLQPLNYDPDRPGRTLFEPPRRPEDALLLARKPPLEACAAAILFEFHPEEPVKSSFQVIPSPTGDRRSHCVLVPLTAPGVLILGGEIPDQPEEPYATGEIYLPRERRLAPLAIPLTTPRTRFGAFSIEGPGGPTVHILGGGTSADETAGFADVERLRMEKR